MKWFKKWSFVIILMITGIIYYKMDESLLKETWQKSMESLGGERPEGGWQQLLWDNIPGLAPEDFSREEGDAAGRGEEAVQPENGDFETQEDNSGQAGPEHTETVQAGQSGDPGQAETVDSAAQEGNPGQTGNGNSAAQEGNPGQTETGDSAAQEGNPGQTETGDLAAQEGNPGQTGTGQPGSLAAENAGLPNIPPELAPKPEIRIGRVEDDYFSDALFLGDSRTVGMQEYGGLGDIATFYASTGMTIYKLFDAEIVEVPDQQEKITVEEALQNRSFGKIYIMMGINEMGRGTVESFAETYGEAVAHLRELQPDAIIYIQGILKVTTARSDKGDYINNEGIEARNEALSQLADGEKIFYLDVNPAVCDEDGGLVKDYTFDGVHLKAKYISLWKEFLKDNAVLLD